MMPHLAPGEIINESFRIIEREVGAHAFSAIEWPIVRRMLHASGDVELRHSIGFHRDAAAAGVQALRGGAPLVTDVAMVAAGINKELLQSLGCRLHCFIDAPDVRHRAEQSGRTRSFCALEQAIAEIGAGIYVIGNAPTALLALCEAVRLGKVHPHLILALPVGFVAVAESKEEALALPIPVLAVRGRRGGSALAAAAVNALLLLAAETKP
jgi:precorrin-8X/cobalt-precorrin-8 methylmutase